VAGHERLAAARGDAQANVREFGELLDWKVGAAGLENESLMGSVLVYESQIRFQILEAPFLISLQLKHALLLSRRSVN
jgi:hypothetical protein